jgi:hypothetical protein
MYIEINEEVYVVQQGLKLYHGAYLKLQVLTPSALMSLL